MARKLDIALLVGTDEITERLGLSRYTRVHDLRRRNDDFPAPVLQLKRAMIWYWPEVERWAKRRGYLPARGAIKATTSPKGSLSDADR